MASRYYAIACDLIDRRSFEVKVGPGNPRCVAGSGLIGFERENDDVYFLGTSRVESAEEKESNGIRRCTVKVDELTDFSRPRRLSVLAGSLEKVYRFLDPDRHFRRNIVGLPKSDYQAIVEERIDLNRSIFRYLFSALPLDIQTEFIRSHIEVLPARSGEKIRDYSELAVAMISFYERKVREPLDMCARTAKIYSQIDASNMPPLQRLELTSGDMDRSVDFGRSVLDIAVLLGENPIFSPVFDNESLLQECKSLTADIDSMNTKTLRTRKWNETLF